MPTTDITFPCMECKANTTQHFQKVTSIFGSSWFILTCIPCGQSRKVDLDKLTVSDEKEARETHPGRSSRWERMRLW